MPSNYSCVPGSHSGISPLVLFSYLALLVHQNHSLFLQHSDLRHCPPHPVSLLYNIYSSLGLSLEKEMATPSSGSLENPMDGEAW